MSTLNRVTIIGRLGQDPEIRYTQNGKAACTLGIATEERRGDGTKDTEWHRVVLWEKTAEIAAKYLVKGRLVAIEGRLKTREWQDKEGAKHRTTEIIASNLVLLGDGGGRGDSRGNDEGRGGQDEQPRPAASAKSSSRDDDIPF